MSDTVEPPPPDGPPAPSTRAQHDVPPRPGILVGSLCLWLAYVVIDGVGTAIGPIAEGVLAGDLIVDVVVLVLAVVMQSNYRRNWARVVLAVLGGLRLALGLWVLVFIGGGVRGGWEFAIGLAWILLMAAIVTMFMPKANAWFAASRNAPRLAGAGPNDAVRETDES